MPAGINSLGADNFFLMSGASALFPLIAQAFVNPGEGVLMEAMTLNQGAKAFRMHGAIVRSVDMDEDGLIPDSVVQQLNALKHEGVRRNCFTPYRHFSCQRVQSCRNIGGARYWPLPMNGT